MIPTRPLAIAAAAAIIAEVAELHGLTPDQVRAHRRFDEYVEARREVYLRLRNGGWSLSRIGRLFGLHPSTVNSAVRGRSQ